MNIYYMIPQELLDDGAIPTSQAGTAADDPAAPQYFVEIVREDGYSFYVQCLKEKGKRKGEVAAACKTGSADWAQGDSYYFTNQVWICTEAMCDNCKAEQPEPAVRNGISNACVKAMVQQCDAALVKARKLADYHGFIK